MIREYPEYRDSNIKWLGKIPEHWEIKPGLFFFREKKIKNFNLIEKRVLSLSYGKIVIKPEEKLHGLVPESFETYQIVSPGDIIIRSTDMQNDKKSLRTGLVNDRGIITSAYICLDSTQHDRSRFNHWLLHGLDLMKVFYGLGSGLRQNLSWDDFKKLPLPLPPFHEQQKIAQYLDWKTAQINKFIKTKKKFIALLKEQKQNIINEAVTKGINPDVKMTESGVDWLGQIPKHWLVRKIKQVVTFNPSKSESLKNTDLDAYITFLPMEKISVEGEILCDMKIPIRKVMQGFTYFRKNDVVLAKITPCFENGKGAYLNTLDTEFGFGTTELFVLRPQKNIFGGFLRLILQSQKFLKLGEQFMSGAAGQQRVKSGFLKNYPIGLPLFSEQCDIVNFIKDETNIIDKTISKANTEIYLIQEYKARLISDVVTGKIDVRSVQIPNFESTEADIDIIKNESTAEELTMEDFGE